MDLLALIDRILMGDDRTVFDDKKSPDSVAGAF